MLLLFILLCYYTKQQVIIMIQTKISQLQPLPQTRVRNRKSLQSKKDKFKNKKLAAFVIRNAAKIIQYARAFSMKLKRSNAHQIVLFPASFRSISNQSPDRNQSLIEQYRKKYVNWYPFYLSSSNVYVDNRHLQLFSRKSDIPVDYSNLGLGRIVCFGDFTKFTPSNRRQSIDIRGSRTYSKMPSSPQRNRNSQNGINYDKIQKIQQQQQIVTQNIYFLGTDQGYVLAINSKTKMYCSALISQNTPIKSINIYKNYAIFACENNTYFYKIQINQQKQKALKFKYLFSAKIGGVGNILIMNFIKYGGLFYLFFIDESGLKKMILKQRLVANIQDFQIIINSNTYNPFTNMKIFHQAHLNRIIITVSCTQQILFYSYHYKQNKHALLYKMPNPKVPPLIPLMHTLNCIQYFPKINKVQVGLNRSSRTTMRLSEKIDKQQYNNDNMDYLIVAVSFSQRIYFIKFWEDHIEISKRAKFFNRVAKIQAYNQQGIIVFLHKQDQNQAVFFSNDFQQAQQKIQQTNKQQMGQQQLKNQQTTKQQNKDVKILIVATLLRKIVSFVYPVHTQILQKIQYEFTVTKKLDQHKRLKTSFEMINNQILILAQNNIVRVRMNSWKDIYLQMHKTQNIQLLQFLVLLKKYDSIYLQKPISFTNLQSFFPIIDADTRQILLQYYYEINEQPPLQFIIQIINQYPHLLLPFILQHKIQNLSQNSKDLLIQYWKNKDQRIVQQLIIGGCEHGQEMAVRKGWMRALKKMVSLGMQIHFPLLKLSSFVVAQKKQLQKLDNIGNADIDYQLKCVQVQKRINNYCLQMVQYSILALQYFLVPQQIQQVQDLKQFLLTLLSQQIINNCFRFLPQQSIKIISKIFKSQQRMDLIDSFDIKQFVNYQKQFKSIIRTNFLSISLCVFSYLSQIYRQITQTKNYTIQQRTKYRQLLAVQHAKLISYSMGNKSLGEYVSPGGIKNVKGKIQFTRPYLLQMLLILVSHNNEYLKQLIHDQAIEKQKDIQTYQCYMQDLLVKIWMDAKQSPINNMTMNNQQIRQIQFSQIKQLITSLQQANTSNNYLLICLMHDLPAADYCKKMLLKFIHCQNKLIKQRLFDWLIETMKDQQCRQLLQIQLMTHLKSIIEVNTQRSRNLFDLYFRNQQKQIIKKIDNPHLQLDYLQIIIIDAQQAQTNLQEYYLNLYLKLLITQEPQRVISVLQESLTKGKSRKIKYDLQQALNVSLQIQKYPQKNRIQIFLYQKLGDIQKCISSYLKILQQLFWQYINCYQTKEQKEKEKKNNANQSQQNKQDQFQFTSSRKTTRKVSLITDIITNKKNTPSQNQLNLLKQSIQKQFTQLTDLIFRQSIKQYNYLGIPLNAMINMAENVRQQKLQNKTHYLIMLAFYFGKIIIQSFERGYLIFFNQWLRKQNRIDLNVLKKYLFQGYCKVISQQNLLENMSKIDKSVLIQNIKQTLLTVQKSIYYQSTCSVCGQQFQQYKGQAMLFSCGHIFHDICIDQQQDGEDYCWECVYKNQIQAMVDFNQMNIVDILNKYCQKKSTNRNIEKQQKAKQVIVSTTKKRMNRLGIYDKRVATIQNQVQIMDIKLEIAQYYQNLNNKKQ